LDIEIRSLTPALVDDYLYFFDNVAFADHKEWSECYCLAFHFEPAWDAEDAGLENPWRERAIKFIHERKVQGYLAYFDNKVIGWCNANDKKNYAALKFNVKPELLEENGDEKVKSVVCFLIAPDMRGKGVAAKLLERVCGDAKEQGYEYVEAYPRLGSKDMYENHHGPDSLYFNQGFMLYKKCENQAVLRKQVLYAG